MVVGPRDVLVALLVARLSQFIRLRMFGVEEVCFANASQRTKRDTKILVIASGHDATASLAETSNSLAVSDAEPIAQVNCKKPQLIKLGRVELSQDRIIAGGILLPVARGDLKLRITVRVFQRCDLLVE